VTPAPAVLSIHAADGIGEQGVVADAGVCKELGCRWVGVVTSVMPTGPEGVDALEPLSLGLVAQQFESVLKAGRPAAARTGVLVGSRQVELVAGLLRDYRIDRAVVAPVVRVRGERVLDASTLAAMTRDLFPLARVVIVRAGDAELLAGETVEDVDGMARAAGTLRSRGARGVLIAGAVHGDRVVDLLDDNGTTFLFDVSRVSAPRVAGLSGVHAAALAAHLALGRPMNKAVDAAQRYVGFRLQRLV
jgi:hydroxymethylpyrimidine kinase/phosphomethylpyrimidine kinase